ncbi:DUF1759 domain-containing protein, partial [Klebsiella pneumoniae]|uniref:DUF1759 domain-containing protein n=1 Tax=Klebsiella pneumoniae TaxID=573 RepID=UPI004055762F
MNQFGHNNDPPVGEDSYSQAWSKLVKTYDNPRVLASLYVRRILECDVKTHKSELQRHEAFLNNVADGIEGFRALNIPDKTDFLLSSLALRALDPRTRNQLEMSHGSPDIAPTADEVIDFVRKTVNAIELY